MNEYYYQINNFVFFIKANEQKLITLRIMPVMPSIFYINPPNNKIIQYTIQYLDDFFKQKFYPFKLDYLDIDINTLRGRIYLYLLNSSPGTKITYKTLATLNHSRAYRYIGNLMAKNPYVLIIPCHRVVSVNEKAINYQYGPQVKLHFQNIEKILDI